MALSRVWVRCVEIVLIHVSLLITQVISTSLTWGWCVVDSEVILGILNMWCSIVMFWGPKLFMWMICDPLFYAWILLCLSTLETTSICFYAKPDAFRVSYLPFLLIFLSLLVLIVVPISYLIHLLQRLKRCLLFVLLQDSTINLLLVELLINPEC